jgi:hypothetical protein
MRKMTSVLTLMLLAASALATQHTPAPDATTGVTVIDGSWGSTTLECTVGAFESEAIQIDGDLYHAITLPGQPRLQQAGAPALPHLAVSIVIPDDAATALQILEAEYTDYPGLRPEPSKGVITRDIDPATVPWSFGPAYDTVVLPSTTASLDSPYILRDFRGQVVHFQPFVWLPESNTLRVYNRILVTVETEGTSVANVIDRSSLPTAVDGEFLNIYRKQFINFDDREDRYTPLEEVGGLLIITADAFHAEVESLADWKMQKGIPTEIVDLSTIGYSSSQVLSFVQTYYDSHDLTFLLLIGDAADVPTPYAAGGSSDPSYSLLAGSDNYPDIFVGRFSGETPDQVATMVERTIEYERDASADSWYHKGVGIASNQGPGDDGEYDNVHMDNIRTDLLGYTYTEVDQIYDPSGTATQVSNALNEGRSIINYTGHGSSTSWSSTGFSVSHVNNLVNNNMLPFIQSVACVNGQFDGLTCFAEAWMRATNGGEPTGAIGIYASSINQSWNSPMCGQDEMIDLLVADEKNSYGGICFNGSMQMMDEYGADGVNMFLTWHIFGDPSVQLRTDSPASLNVTHAGSMFPTAESYLVNCGGVAGALCTLWGDGVIYGSAVADGSGLASIPMGATPVVGADLTLTVTAYNYTTLQEAVEVIPPGGPYVSLTGFTVADENGELNPGENPPLTLTMENVGVETASGVWSMLSTSDPWVTVIDDEEYYGDMDPGAVVTIPEGFRLAVAPDAPEDHPVTFELLTEAAGEWSWESGFTLTIRYIYELYWADDCETIDQWSHSAPDGWSDQWHLSVEQCQSPTHSWKCGDTGTADYANSLDARLISPPVALRSNSRLSFKHWMEGEVSGTYPDSAYDGGIIEISTDGNNWTQLTPDNGGYNAYFRTESGGGNPASHPFTGGTPCWSGSFDWADCVINLSAYAEETVQFRFRFGSDSGGGNEGWYIDDLELVGVTGTELEPVTDLTISVSGGYVTLSWSAAIGAASYNVYGSPDPYSGFGLLGNTSMTQWTVPLTAGSRFFQVTSVN